MKKSTFLHIARVISFHICLQWCEQEQTAPSQACCLNSSHYRGIPENRTEQSQVCTTWSKKPKNLEQEKHLSQLKNVRNRSKNKPSIVFGPFTSLIWLPLLKCFVKMRLRKVWKLFINFEDKSVAFNAWSEHIYSKLWYNSPLQILCHIHKPNTLQSSSSIVLSTKKTCLMKNCNTDGHSELIKTYLFFWSNFKFPTPDWEATAKFLWSNISSIFYCHILFNGTNKSPELFFNQLSGNHLDTRRIKTRSISWGISM